MMINFLNRRLLKTPILGINARNLHFVYPKNPRKYFPLADDKILCKQVLHEQNISCPVTYATIERIGDISVVWNIVRNHNELAIKPANGSGGGGILILKKDQNQQWRKGKELISEPAIFAHLARIIMGMFSFGSKDQVLIEKCINAHTFFNEIYPLGVPDFRVILLHDQPVMSMLRMPTDQSDGKANLHQGGLGIGVDMEQGKLTFVYDGNCYHEVHPDNNNMVSGKKIPQWEAILDLAIQTSKAFPLNYLGVDIVLDEKEGPMVLEINVRPGLGIQLANKTGLKNILEQINLSYK